MERGAVIVRRKVGESVVIGEGVDRIVVELLPNNGGKAQKLRIEAPRVVPIRRDDTGARSS